MELMPKAASDVIGTAETARVLPDKVRPVPVKSLNDSPLIMRLVVEAVLKEA